MCYGTFFQSKQKDEFYSSNKRYLMCDNSSLIDVKGTPNIRRVCILWYVQYFGSDDENYLAHGLRRRSLFVYNSARITVINILSGVLVIRATTLEPAGSRQVLIFISSHYYIILYLLFIHMISLETISMNIAIHFL